METRAALQSASDALRDAESSLAADDAAVVLLRESYNTKWADGKQRANDMSAACIVAEQSSDDVIRAARSRADAICEALQLFGGYGYTAEYPISRFYVDARIQTIYGGSSEIMRELVARSMLGR